MRKLIYIYFLLLIASACSVIKVGKSTSDFNPELSRSDNVLLNVRNNNLTGRSFFIQKADISITTAGNTESFIASVKYTKAGIYLVSLRSRTGIEAVRIYLSKDTLLANDRFNRQVLYGKPAFLQKKYGISAFILPILFGDFISEDIEPYLFSNCNENMFKYDANVKGSKINYAVDCDKEKVLSATLEGSMNSSFTELKFDKFVRKDNIIYPANIQFKYKEIEILIVIDKLVSEWNESIEFIPGNNYELIELL